MRSSFVTLAALGLVLAAAPSFGTVSWKAAPHLHAHEPCSATYSLAQHVEGGSELRFKAWGHPDFVRVSSAGVVDLAPVQRAHSGHYHFTVAVSDGETSATTNVSLEVRAMGKPPVWQVPQARACVGQPFRAKVSDFAWGFQAENGNFLAGNVPAWLSLSHKTGEMAGNPTAADVGRHKILLTADVFGDGRCAEDGMLTIVVSECR